MEQVAPKNKQKTPKNLNTTKIPLKVKNLFRYFGGDSLIVDKIANILPKGHTLIEVFGGSGAVSLYASRYNLYKNIILNDKDPTIYGAYMIFKNHPEKIPSIVETTIRIQRKIMSGNRGGAKNDIKKLIQEIRTIKNPLEKGIRYLILTRVGMLVDLYSKRSRIVLDIKTRKRKHLEEGFWYRHLLLQKIKPSNKDAFQLLTENDRKGVVFYLDPPFIEEKINNIYGLNFTEKDAEKLAKTLRKLRHAKFVLKIRPYDWNKVYKRFLEGKTKPIRISYKVNFINNEKRGNKRFYVFAIKD